MAKTNQHVINIAALTNASAEVMKEAARHDRDTLGGAQVRADCTSAASMMVQQSQVEALLFIGEQLERIASGLEISRG